MPRSQLAGKAALAVAALFAAWIVVRSAAADGFAQRALPIGAVVSPGDPRTIFALSMAVLGQSGGTIDRATADRSSRASAEAPLAEEPFILAATAERGNPALADRLAAEALRRNPRSRAARLFLLEQHLRAGRVDEAAREITMLGRLLPSASPVLVPALASFSAEPRASVALSKALQRDEPMRQRVLEHMVEHKVDPAIIVRVAGRRGGAAAAGGQPRWQRQLVDRLVAKGDVRSAHALWQDFAGIEPARSADAMFDARFARGAGAPPFGWEYFADEAGAAEPAGASRLQLDYYGKAPTLLARKLAVLPPGGYRLALTLDGRAPVEGSRVALRLQCFGKGPRLTEIVLGGGEGDSRAIAGTFAVPPANCPAFWISFVGVPGEIAESRNLVVRDLVLASR